MDQITELERLDRSDFSSMLNRMERTYLAVLRAGALVIATLLLLYAAWLGLSGIYKVSRDAKSVQEAPAVVSAQEITDIDLKGARDSKEEAEVDPLQGARTFYTGFRKQYLALYRSKLENFLQKDDLKISDQDFDSQFLRQNERLDAIKRNDLDFIKDMIDLQALLRGMTEAADAKISGDRLRAYQAAKKGTVSRIVTETKTEQYCSYYGYYSNQCISWDTREVPVKRTVTEAKLPDGVISPPDLFRAYHKKFISTLVAHRTDNAAKADSTRVDIAHDNATGAQNLWTAMLVVGGFVVLMFLFLLIALERHQRRIAGARAE
jgi:hypothetical protein